MCFGKFWEASEEVAKSIGDSFKKITGEKNIQKSLSQQDSNAGKESDQKARS